MSVISLTFALLLFAASIASYGLSVSLAARASRGMIVVGLSVGTTLLVAAVWLVVGSTSSWFAARFSGDALSNENSNGASRSASFVTSGIPHRFPPDGREVGDSASSPALVEESDDFMHVDDRGSRLLQPHGKSSLVPRASSEETRTPRDTRSLEWATTARAPVMDAWSATNCVAAIQPDPAEPTRWWLENECGTAIAILFSARGSGSWSYLSRPMLLPAKFDRFTPHSEETQHGEEIRFVACVVTTDALVKLIVRGRGLEPESEWLEDLDQAGSSDECFVRVAQGARSGRASGRSIEQLLGPDVPGRIRLAR